jgi:hypothetical protein
MITTIPTDSDAGLETKVTGIISHVVSILLESELNFADDFLPAVAFVDRVAGINTFVQIATAGRGKWKERKQEEGDQTRQDQFVHGVC